MDPQTCSYINGKILQNSGISVLLSHACDVTHHCHWRLVHQETVCYHEHIQGLIQAHLIKLPYPSNDLQIVNYVVCQHNMYMATPLDLHPTPIWLYFTPWNCITRQYISTDMQIPSWQWWTYKVTTDFSTYIFHLFIWRCGVTKNVTVSIQNKNRCAVKTCELKHSQQAVAIVDSVEWNLEYSLLKTVVYIDNKNLCK